MAADNRQRNRLPPFVPLLLTTLDEPAWRAMSHGAQMLYVTLKRRYNLNNHNNGRIFLSQRDAVKQLRSHHDEIGRWFRELQHYGFIVLTMPHVLGVEGKGKAPRWRLTELGYMKEAPTRDFARWDGNKFKDVKAKSRAGKQARREQENQHTGVPESHVSKAHDVLGIARIAGPHHVPENQRRTILPSPGPASARALGPQPTPINQPHVQHSELSPEASLKPRRLRSRIDLTIWQERFGDLRPARRRPRINRD